MRPTDALRNSPLFSGIPHQTFEKMARRFRPESWPRQTEIMSGAQTSRRFIILTAGRVKISRTNGHSGRELTLWLLGPGDGFDVVALLDGQPHAVLARTLEEAHGFSVPMAQMRSWIEANAALRHAVHRYAAQQLRELSELAADLALHDTATRLARLLLRYFGPPDGHPLERAARIDDLPHDEIAAMIGSVRVVVNRLLARFRRSAVTRTESGRLRVLDLQRLAEQAGMAESGSKRL